MNDAYNVARIRSAIAMRGGMDFNYDGLARTACPVVYGTIAGRVAFLAYQFAGRSRSGGIPCWRLFYLDKVVDLIESEVALPTLPEYTLTHPHFDVVLATAPPFVVTKSPKQAGGERLS